MSKENDAPDDRNGQPPRQFATPNGTNQILPLGSCLSTDRHGYLVFEPKRENLQPHWRALLKEMHDDLGHWLAGKGKAWKEQLASRA